MKKTVPTKNSFLNLSSGLLVAIFAFPAFSSTDAISDISTHPTTDPPSSIVISKVLENKNYNIEMIATPSLRQLLISAGPQQKKIYRFYLFDIDGKLKGEADIHRNGKTAIVNLSKGNYYFEIYNNDKKIEKGQLTIK